MPYCRVAGCGRSITRHSRWRAHCNSHHCRQRRHGHAEQTGVTVADLKLYRRLVHERIRRNADSSLWPKLEECWQVLLEHCRGVMAAWNRGQAMNKTKVRAAQELLKLAEYVEPRTVIETALSLYLLQDADPRRFRSDEAFRFQLVRRVRCLADVNAGEYWDHITKRTKRVYRDLPPRVTRMCGQWLNEVFGLAGLHVAKLERQADESDRKARQEFHEALQALC